MERREDGSEGERGGGDLERGGREVARRKRGEGRVGGGIWAQIYVQSEFLMVLK